MEYLTDIFCENGYDRKTLQKIINSFEKKIRGTTTATTTTITTTTITTTTTATTITWIVVP